MLYYCIGPQLPTMLSEGPTMLSENPTMLYCSKLLRGPHPTMLSVVSAMLSEGPIMSLPCSPRSLPCSQRSQCTMLSVSDLEGPTMLSERALRCYKLFRGPQYPILRGSYHAFRVPYSLLCFQIRYPTMLSVGSLPCSKLLLIRGLYHVLRGS